MGQRYILVEVVSTGTKAEFDNFINRVNEKIDEGLSPAEVCLLKLKNQYLAKLK